MTPSKKQPSKAKVLVGKCVQIVLATLDARDIVFLVGIGCLGIGLYGYDKHLALVAIGAVLLLSIKPLLHWIK